MIDVPCSAAEAVRRAQSMVHNGGQYLLGAGDYRPRTTGDLPWTLKDGEEGSDCAGFAICWCWKLRRHRPGFNHGVWSTVEDDINVNSIKEDAEHKHELAALGGTPEPGDLVCYPTFVSHGKQFIGHVALVESVDPGYTAGAYNLLNVIQCHGPNHFRPGVVRTDGAVFTRHDEVWPGHPCKIIVMKERV